jgi:hypothetical protein
METGKLLRVVFQGHYVKKHAVDGLCSLMEKTRNYSVEKEMNN